MRSQRLVSQHEDLPLYGASELFIHEVGYYRDAIHRLPDDCIGLAGFNSMRALKAAIVAAIESERHIWFDAAPEEHALFLAAQSGAMPLSHEESSSLPKRALCGGAGLLPYAQGEVRVIGELLNPNFRMQAKKILQEQNEPALHDMLREQCGNGATVLSFSCEARDLNASQALSWLLPHFALIDTPVYLEAEKVSWLELVLPTLPGRPLVQCRQCDSEARAHIFALCKQHLAVVVLSEAEITDRNRQARLEHLRSLVYEALASGLRSTDLVVEVQTLSAPQAPLLLHETLETISLVKQELELPIMVPISQVSRSRLLHGWSNAFYAACAIDRGADFLLANPSQREVMALVQAANELRR